MRVGHAESNPPKLHAQYAKACEASEFQEAVQAYENAHDLDSVVRLH